MIDSQNLAVNVTFLEDEEFLTFFFFCCCCEYIYIYNLVYYNSRLCAEKIYEI